jgi:hypothetical protein
MSETVGTSVNVMSINEEYMIPLKLIKKIELNKNTENMGSRGEEMKYNLVFEDIRHPKDNSLFSRFQFKKEFVIENVHWEEKYKKANTPEIGGGNNKRVNHTKKSKSKKSRKNHRKSTRRH